MFPTEPVPESIGAYKILRRLGGSGSTCMYLGRRDGPLGFRRTCALKLVPNAAEGDPRFADELAREASICATLNHPAIVRMFDFFEHEDQLVLVLEHVEGVSLERLLQHLANRQQKLVDAAIYYIGHRIAGALAHAHAATDASGEATPVVHRNLHPENIVVGWDGQVRLTGFGLGKILGRTPDTVAGVVKGTPGYMAPEQARGERVTAKADVYGLGLLLWSLLTNRRPPDDGMRPTAISTIRLDLPRPIVTLVDAALMPLPEERKIACQEIEQTLGKVARPERGKAELVMRAQSAHASIEVEDADREDDRRPTIPVKGKGGQAGKSGEITKRLAQELLLGKDLVAKELGLDAAAQPEELAPVVGEGEAPAPPAVGEASAPAADVEPQPASAGRVDSSEAITIPVPSHDAPLLVELKPEAWKPALPDRETFGRLFDAAKRATEREAESVAALPPDAAPPAAVENDDEEPEFLGETLPVGTPQPVEFGKPPIPFGAPRVPPGPFGGLPPAPPELTPVHFALPPGLAQPSSSPAPPGNAPPTADMASGSVQPKGTLLPRGSRSLSTAGTVAVSAVTATVVAALWIYVARRDRPTSPVAVKAATLTAIEPIAPPPEPTAQAVASAPAPAPAPAPPPGATERAPAAAAPQGDVDLSTLPQGHGFFTVAFPEPAQVYMSGRLAGPVNEALVVRCGRWFLRLGRATTERRIPEWVTAGMTVHVTCQGATRVDMKSAPSAKVKGKR
jgi:eukaryotic-like serine/threonine-protein kinase